MKQLTILELIWKLTLHLFREGNSVVYYNICGHADCKDVPMEVEGVEIREAYGERKVTIW